MKEKKVKEKKVKKKADKKKIKEVKKPEGHGRQTKIAVVIMVVLIVSVFLFNWVLRESRKFEYEGVDFYKEKEGEIMYYKSLLGYVTATGDQVPFILKLRNDPRELSEIPIDGEIRLKKETILSLSPEVANCSNTYVSLIDFSGTLKAFSIQASPGTPDRRFAKEINASFADCRHAKEKTVIIMKEGNETKITQDGDCYIIEIKDCEIQKSSERFLLEFITGSVIYIK
jgi:hypothetical protein